MSYAYCDRHKVSWNGDEREECLECEEAVSLPDHLLDEPDECLCSEHGKPRPCPYCGWERKLDRYDEMRKRKDEEIE